MPSTPVRKNSSKSRSSGKNSSSKKISEGKRRKNKSNNNKSSKERKSTGQKSGRGKTTKKSTPSQQQVVDSSDEWSEEGSSEYSSDGEYTYDDEYSDDDEFVESDFERRKRLQAEADARQKEQQEKKKKWLEFQKQKKLEKENKAKNEDLVRQKQEEWKMKKMQELEADIIIQGWLITPKDRVYCILDGKKKEIRYYETYNRKFPDRHPLKGSISLQPGNIKSVERYVNPKAPRQPSLMIKLLETHTLRTKVLQRIFAAESEKEINAWVSALIKVSVPDASSSTTSDADASPSDTKASTPRASSSKDATSEVQEKAAAFPGIALHVQADSPTKQSDSDDDDAPVAFPGLAPSHRELHIRLVAAKNLKTSKRKTFIMFQAGQGGKIRSAVSAQRGANPTFDQNFIMRVKKEKSVHVEVYTQSSSRDKKKQADSLIGECDINIPAPKLGWYAFGPPKSNKKSASTSSNNTEEYGKIHASFTIKS